MSMKSVCFFSVFVCCMIFNPGSVTGQSFSSSELQNAGVANPTSLQFGPDGKLYVAQQDGYIKVLTVQKNGSNDYRVTSSETIGLVKAIPNHNDDGSLAGNVNKRQVTGLYVDGTAANPVIYVLSSDSRIGAGGYGDVNLDTNSGVLSKLYKNNGSWRKIDLVRGLPRSEENHAPNGMALDKQTNTLFLAIGGGTNAGAPSKMWTYICEYALAAAILSVDLNAIEGMPDRGTSTAHPYKYDLPTLDDPSRPNNTDGTDVNDPWGGNDGLNMAKIIEGGPVQVYASGFRNPYDVIISETPGRERRIYTIDNGPNANWGGYPDNEGSHGSVTNNYVPGEPGSTSDGVNDEIVRNWDGLHHIGHLDSYVRGSYYGGHPCPIRANPAGAGLYTNSGSTEGGTRVWRTSKTDPDYPLPADWPPVPVSMANPVEGDYQNPGIDDPSLIVFPSSTNGFCEYTATTFSGSMQGDLLATSFTGEIYRIRMNSAGTNVLNQLGPENENEDEDFASGMNKPLDVVAQGDGDPFPGTIWVAEWGGSAILVFEPQDINCTNTYSASIDEDGDGYDNADEIDNGTNPCSGSSKPSDNDKDLVSDLNDPDDDNDGIPDVEDYFALDGMNGDTTSMPTHYHLFNFDPGTGFFGLGFTGMMCNRSTDYLDQFNPDAMIAGGAVGALTVEAVTAGDAVGSANNQDNAFQFGVKVSSVTGKFTVRAGLSGYFFNNKAPQDYQSQGMYIGTGDQDNFLMVALNANGGAGGITVVHEVAGTPFATQYSISSIPENTAIFYLYVDPVNGTATPYYSLDGNDMVALGQPIPLEGELLAAVRQEDRNLAVGIISTSRGATTFNATWDFISVYPGFITGTKPKQTFSAGNVILYPNPVDERLGLHFEKTIDQPLSLEVYSSIGTLVGVYPLPAVTGGTDYSLELPDLSPGFYMVKLKGKEGVATESLRFIKK